MVGRVLDQLVVKIPRQFDVPAQVATDSVLFANLSFTPDCVHSQVNTIDLVLALRTASCVVFRALVANDCSPCSFGTICVKYSTPYSLIGFAVFFE